MKEDKKILNRIKKLLALANNNQSESEAQSAMAVAQRMMIENSIEMSDVEGYVDNETEKEVIESPATDFISLKFWHKDLARVIADNFKCEWWISAEFKKKRRIVFFGLKEDVAIAKEVFIFACKSIEYCSNIYIESNDITGRSDIARSKNDYIIGYLKGLSAKFKEQIEKNNWALALVKDEIVLREVKKKGLVTSRGSSVSVNSDSSARERARSAGFKDGKNFDYGGKKRITNG